jgi:hypothetical protein
MRDRVRVGDLAAKKSDPYALHDAGGWSSMAMPSRYIERAKIANERIVLDDDEG